MKLNFRTAAAAASLALLASATPVLACQGTTVLFEDDFSFTDPAWGGYDGTTIDNGQMTISVEPGRGYTLLNQSSLYNDFDACVDVVQHNDDPTSAWASLVFWGVDFNNFYTLDVAGNGYIKVSRLQNNKWLSPVDWTLTEGVVKPGEELNSLRVMAQGNVASVFVNGQMVAQFRGQPPEGGGLIGVYGAAPDGSAATYDFMNLKVTSADGEGGSTAQAPDRGDDDEGDDAGSGSGGGGSGDSGGGSGGKKL
jgi:hypothetical protein